MGLLPYRVTIVLIEDMLDSMAPNTIHGKSIYVHAAMGYYIFGYSISNWAMCSRLNLYIKCYCNGQHMQVTYYSRSFVFFTVFLFSFTVFSFLITFA